MAKIVFLNIPAYGHVSPILAVAVRLARRDAKRIALGSIARADKRAEGIPASLVRFAALHGYDNVREPRLPPELRDRNPNGRMWRRIEGEWTRADAPIFR